MAFLGFFLKSIFLIALLVAVFLVGIILYLYMRVKNMARSFNGAAGARQKDSSATQQRASQKRRSEEYDDGVTVEEELYDRRSSSEVKRKIFSKDEGEYVDFEEEK